ncbi:MAG: glycosyltransferase 87 family protein [Candidatus Dormibacteria bacterium]
MRDLWARVEDWAMPVLALASAALVVAFAIGEVQRELGDPGDTDYLPLVTAGTIVDSGSHCLYCYRTQQVTEDRLLGISTSVPPPNAFGDTPLAAVLMAPLAPLPLRTGLAVFDVLSLLMLAASALIVLRLLPGRLDWERRTLLVALGVGSLPALTAIAQWDSLMLLAALLAVLLLRGAQGDGVSDQRRAGPRALGAGLLLSLLLLKPQVVWLALPALLAARSWRVLIGFALGGAVNLASGLLLIGPGQTLQLVPFLSSTLLPYASVKVGLPALAAVAFGTDRAGVVAGLVLAAIAVAACWRWREQLRDRPVTAIGIGVAASIAFSPYVGIVDLGLLTLATVAWAQTSAAEPIAALLLVDIAWAVDFLAGGGHVHTLPVALFIFVLGAAWRLLRSRAGAWRPDLGTAHLGAPG